MTRGASGGTEESWSAFTVIDEDELREHLFEVREQRGPQSKLQVNSYCIEVNGGTINTSQFIEFITSKFPYFVMSEAEIEAEEFPYKAAIDRTDYRENPRHDGTYGELLLFLIMDAFFDIPMVSHKISGKQNPRDQVKGSDGIFFGQYQGSESLAFGEAKIYADLDDGIASALDSTERFHGSQAETRRNQELRVATRNLSDNLSENKIEYLAENLTSESQDYQLIHPIFIAFQSDRVHEIQTAPGTDPELREELIRIIRGDTLKERVQSILRENYSSLERQWLLFLFLPVTDVDEFRERMQDRIFPHSTHHQ